MTTHLVYIEDGDPYVGTVQDLAKAIGMSQYTGSNVERYAWITADAGAEGTILVRERIGVESTGYNEHEYATLTVTVEGVEGEGTFTVDGRA